MKALVRVCGFAIVIALVFAAGTLLWARSHGFSARAKPAAIEASLVKRIRWFAMPAAVRQRPNPVAATPVAIREGLEHYADHCAVCHANDGTGQTDIGKGLYPPAPDMRLSGTQGLTDGELFSIIENGVRFTGMPAWATGTPEGEEASWKLVHFIRHLPKLRPEEIEDLQDLNPISMEKLKQQLEEERFLEGGPPPPKGVASEPHVHPARPR